MFDRTRAAASQCKDHLQRSDAFGTEIESFLTQHLLVMLCAEVQTTIYSEIERHSAAIESVRLQSFVKNSASRVLRSIMTGDLSGFIALFGASAKKAFIDAITDRDQSIYNNAVGRRHDVAHKQGAQITFRELSDVIEAAERIVVALSNAIPDA